MNQDSKTVNPLVMKKKLTFLLCFLTATSSYSQDCSDLLKWGIFNTVSQSTSSAVFTSNVSDFVRKYESVDNKQESVSAAISVFGLGSAGGSYTNDELKYRYEEAKAFNSSQFSSSQGMSFASRFVDKTIVDSYTQCLTLAGKSVKIDFKPNDNSSSISIRLSASIMPGVSESKLILISVAGEGKIKANRTRNVIAKTYQGGDNALETTTNILNDIWSWTFSRVPDTDIPGIKYKRVQIAFTVSADLFVLNLPEVRDRNYIKPRVGEIVASMLDVTTFERLNNVADKVKWVLANGVPCPPSDYLTLDPVKHAKLPDLRGVFLRGKNYDRDLESGNAQGDLTLGSEQTDAIQDHSHSFPSNPYFISQSKASGAHLQSGMSAGSAFEDGGVSGISRLTINGTGQMSTGQIAPETRPNNVTVNYFICIDYH